MNNSRILIKISLLMSFLFINITLLIIIFTSSANNYEISIYNVYPWYFWGLISVSIFLLCMILILNEFYFNNYGINIYVYIGFVLCALILASMPLIRGYFLYGDGDAYAHVMWTNYILKHGIFSQDNFYPVLHVFSSEFANLFSMGSGISLMFISLISYSSYLIFIFIFTRLFFRDRKIFVLSIILIISSTIAAGSTYIGPGAISFRFIPLILFILFKKDFFIRSNLPLVILLVLSSFCHPMTMLYLVIMFFILSISIKIYEFFRNNSGEKRLKTYNKHVLRLGIIGSFLFVIFYGWSERFVLSVNGFINAFFTAKEINQFNTYANLIESTNIPLIETIKLFILSYGKIIILFLINLIVFILICSMIVKNRKKDFINQDWVFLFLTISFFICMAVFGLLASGFLTFSRVFGFLFIFLPMFFSLNYLTQLNRKHIRIKTLIPIFFVVGVLIFLSISTVYISPITKSVNPQFTKSETAGSRWFLDHNMGFETFTLGVSLTRQHQMYGRRGILNLSKSVDKGIADHFMYDTSPNFGYNFNKETYISISVIGRLWYPSLWSDYTSIWRFTESDFRKLEDDFTINKIYLNGETEFYFVTSGLINNEGLIHNSFS